MSQTPQKGWVGTLLQEASLTKEEMVGSPAEAAQTTPLNYPLKANSLKQKSKHAYYRPII